MKITIEAQINAPLAKVWSTWITPEDICQWNAASDDWHTTAATQDVRVGGKYSSRMEAKDGSFGFDFEGEYTVVDPMTRLHSMLGDRELQVEFVDNGDSVTVRETFDAEDQNPIDMQRAGWQAILDNFKRHVEAKAG
jgi:uncharacterized protein YndB with AHSA1/START domain